MSRFTNEDRICGHKYFDSAIQLSVIAAEKTRTAPGVVVDWKEAKRLYKCAIVDTEMAIKEIESDPRWAEDASHWLKHMKEQKSAWEGEIYTMPG